MYTGDYIPGLRAAHVRKLTAAKKCYVVRLITISMDESTSEQPIETLVKIILMTSIQGRQVVTVKSLIKW